MLKANIRLFANHIYSILTGRKLLSHSLGALGSKSFDAILFNKGTLFFLANREIYLGGQKYTKREVTAIDK